MSRLEENYKFLQEYYPEHANELLAEQADIEKQILMADLPNHDGVKHFLQLLRRLIKDAEESLISDETLDEMGAEATQKRRDLKTRRDVYKWVIKIFQESKAAVRGAEAATDEKIKEIKSYENENDDEAPGVPA